MIKFSRSVSLTKACDRLRKEIFYCARFFDSCQKGLAGEQCLLLLHGAEKCGASFRVDAISWGRHQRPGWNLQKHSSTFYLHSAARSLLAASVFSFSARSVQRKLEKLLPVVVLVPFILTWHTLQYIDWFTCGSPIYCRDSARQPSTGVYGLMHCTAQSIYLFISGFSNTGTCTVI